MSATSRQLGTAGVVALLLLCLLAPAGAPAARTNPRLGSHAMIGPSMAPRKVDALFKASHDAGLGTVRLDVHVASLFPTGLDAPDWRTLDVIRAAARRHHMQVLAHISGPPSWNARCPFPVQFDRCPPAAGPAWPTMVQAIAAHAPEIRYWEILNEANLRHVWFYGTADDYAKLIRVTGPAIRRGNRRAKIVFTGVVPPYEGWLAAVLRQAGVIRSFDIANVHLRGGARKLDDMVRHARKVYARLGFKGSLWVTETGYPSDPAFQFDPRFVGHDAASGYGKQSAYLRAAIPALLCGGATRVFVTIRDLDAHGSLFTSEGLLTWPGMWRKPAYRRVAAVARTLLRRSGRRHASGSARGGRARRGCGLARAPRRHAR